MLLNKQTKKTSTLLALLVLSISLVSMPLSAGTDNDSPKLGPVAAAMKKAAKSNEELIPVIIRFAPGASGKLKKEDRAKGLCPKAVIFGLWIMTRCTGPQIWLFICKIVVFISGYN